MDFGQDFIEKTGLSEDQVKAVSEHVQTHVKTLEQEWGAKANENAEKILDGAAAHMEKLTGIKREKGQKLGDYYVFAGDTYLKGKANSLAEKEKQLDKQLKAGGGSDELKSEYEKLKAEKDELLKVKAEYDEWKENDYKGKYEETSKNMIMMEQNVAFSNVKPSFHESVNKYEANAKWGDFINSTKEKYDIKLDKDSVPVAIEKDNIHRVIKLSDLVDKDPVLTGLKQGEMPNGLGGNTKTRKIDGLPFEVPENITNQEKHKLINERLDQEGLTGLTPERAKKFAEYWAKIKG